MIGTKVFHHIIDVIQESTNVTATAQITWNATDTNVAACVDEVVRREGRIDAVVNCVNRMIIGSVEEIRNSDNERVQNLLNRRFEEEELDPDEYLERLTGGALHD